MTRHILATTLPLKDERGRNKFFESFHRANLKLFGWLRLLTGDCSQLIVTRIEYVGTLRPQGSSSRRKLIFLKGLILAQNERCRRGLGMQVEREPASHPCSHH